MIDHSAGDPPGFDDPRETAPQDPRQTPPDRLERLLSAYFDGLLGKTELEELEGMLLTDREAAERAAGFCLAHRQVFDVVSEQRFHDLIDQVLVGRPGPPRDWISVRSEPQPPTEAGLPVLRTTGMIAVGVLAAGMLAAAAMLAVHIALPHGSQEQTSGQGVASAPGRSVETSGPGEGGGQPVAGDVALEGPSGEPDPTAAATLTQLLAPEWTAPAGARHVGQVLRIGDRLALESGRAKLTFDCGAEIVLEGPCDFELQSSMVGLLHRGRLTADVPRRAFGFGVLCPSVDLIDLGTSFGVNVADGGDAELHVFKGEVLCRPSGNDQPRNRDLIHVQANQGMSFAARGEAKRVLDEGSDPEPGSERPLAGTRSEDQSRVPLNPKQFAALRSARRPIADPPAPLLARGLALWLAADRQLVTDSDGRVIAWPDLMCGDNLSTEDALQPDPLARPLLVADALAGRPAVRFDGDSDFLVTTPLQTTDNQTVLIVCQYSPGALRKGRLWGGQILNYDGPPSRYLSDTFEPGVLQIGEPLLESEFRPTLLSAQVFAGFVGATTIEAGRIDGHEVGVERPIIVAYTYNYSKGWAELRIDGELCGRGRAFAPQGITSRKILGRHAWMQNYFNGDLAELLIYNRALSADELAEATRALAVKYEVEFRDFSGG